MRRTIAISYSEVELLFVLPPAISSIYTSFLKNQKKDHLHTFVARSCISAKILLEK